MRVSAATGGRRYDLGDLAHRRGPDSGRVIDRQRPLGLVPGGEHRVDQIADIEIGLRLVAVAQHFELARIGFQLAQEIIDHAMGRALSDHVGKAQYHRAAAERVGEDRDIGFRRELARAIERNRLKRRVILVQQRIGLSEYGRGAGKEQAFDAMRPHRLQHRHRGQLIELQIEPEVAGAGGNIGIRRQVKHRVETRLVEQGCERRSVEHIELDEAKCRQVDEMRDVAAPAEPQIVHAPDLAAACEQALAKMAADEACTPGD